MQRKKVETLFPLINSKVTGYRGKWVLGHCPFAPWRHESGDAHPSFAIEANDSKKSIFKCFSCAQGGDLMHLQSLLTEALHKSKAPGYQMGKALELIAEEFSALEFDKNLPEYGETPVQEDYVFPDQWLASFPPVGAFPAAVAYLASRGVKKSLYEAIDLRYDHIQNRVCFPYRNSKGQLMGVQGRYAADKVPAHILRYYFYKHKGHLNTHAWLGEDAMDLDRPLVLVEGPFDYASTIRAYPNVVASFSAGLSQAKLQRIADAAEIVTFYDAGKGGDQARQIVGKFFAKLKVPVSHVVPQNAGGDPGSMLDSAEVGAHLTNHVKLLYKD